MSDGVVAIAHHKIIKHRVRMKISRTRYGPALGIGTLFIVPILLSYPFLAAWNRASSYANPLADWLYPVLLLSLIAGCAGFVPLPLRMSTKLLMLLFYIPAAAFTLFLWSYLWCSLCDF